MSPAEKELHERLACLIWAAIDFHAAHQQALQYDDPDWSRRFQGAAKTMLDEVVKARKALTPMNMTTHEHCWHPYLGPIWGVPDGHIIQKCCGCLRTRTVHVETIHLEEAR